jgi:hypothetical protein
MPVVTISRHRTSQGEVAYVRQPDGTTHVVLGGRQLAVARPAAPTSSSTVSLRGRLGLRLVELGLHLLVPRQAAA